MSRWLLMLALASGLSGCAMRGQTARTTQVPALPRTASAALLGEIGVLAAKQQATTVCPDVCRLAEQICEAASKICDIAAEHPDDPDLTDRCSTASIHCALARRRCAECR